MKKITITVKQYEAAIAYGMGYVAGKHNLDKSMTQKEIKSVCVERRKEFLEELKVKE